MKKRKISIGMPSGVLNLTLWEGTEDEERFPIRSLHRGTPYVTAYGIKYELTPEEAKAARQLYGSFIPIRRIP